MFLYRPIEAKSDNWIDNGISWGIMFPSFYCSFVRGLFIAAVQVTEWAI